MSERMSALAPLPGFEEMVEPIKIVEIGCGVRMEGTPCDRQDGRIYHLPYEYKGIDREEEFIGSTRYLDEDEQVAARERAAESGIILGNAADLPFEDDSIDVVTMRSVFGQFTGKDFREFENLRGRGLMEAFRVLRLGGIIAISEENTPWDADNVFHYLNNVGFTVIDYTAMQQNSETFESRDFFGRAVGELRGLYAPENEPWLNKLGQFYGEVWGGGGMAIPRQYLMVGQKQQPATVEQTLEWHEWSVSTDRFNHSGSECTPRQKTYRCGERVTQEFLPGMYTANGHCRDQEQLFYMPPRYFF